MDILARSLINLLEVDPELAAHVSAQDRELAERALRARAVELDPSAVQGDEWQEPLPSPAFGLLLVEGCLVRETFAGRRGTLEVVCPGDLIRPWDDPALLDERPARWRALDRSVLAVLDGAFARRAARWPEVASLMLSRMMRRHRQLSLMLALHALPRVEDRILSTLWFLAERMGHVTSDGVTVRLALRQADLGAMAGARRPTVNVTLKQLREDGLVLDWGADGFRLDPSAGERVAARLRGPEFAT